MFEEQQLLEAMRRQRGYTYVHEREGLQAATSAPLLGLFARRDLPYEVRDESRMRACARGWGVCPRARSPPP